MHFKMYLFLLLEEALVPSNAAIVGTVSGEASPAV